MHPYVITAHCSPSLTSSILQCPSASPLGWCPAGPAPPMSCPSPKAPWSCEDLGKCCLLSHWLLPPFNNLPPHHLTLSPLPLTRESPQLLFGYRARPCPRLCGPSTANIWGGTGGVRCRLCLCVGKPHPSRGSQEQSRQRLWEDWEDMTGHPPLL